MRRTATADPTPEPVAALRFLTSLTALEVPTPAPVAARRRLRKKTTEGSYVKAALFSLLGTQFGGDGHLTFALPKLEAPAPNLHWIICTEGMYPSRP
jgi:hypothetical protein